MEPIDGLEQHCTTLARNSDCPYIPLGCLGCTFRHRGPYFGGGLPEMPQRSPAEIIARGTKLAEDLKTIKKRGGVKIKLVLGDDYGKN